MALATTTLGAAVTANDITIRVASATGFVKGNYIRIDNEDMVQNGDADGLVIPVRRGQLGTRGNVTHANGVNVNVKLPTDVPEATAQLAEPIPHSNQWRLPKYSYDTAGAISPVGGLHEIVGTAKAMTLAVPSKDIDGDLLVIVGSTKAAHTVTVATGVGAGGSGYTVLTFPAGGNVAVALIAFNGVWVQLSSPISGTLTNVAIPIT